MASWGDGFGNLFDGLIALVKWLAIALVAAIGVIVWLCFR